MIYVVGCDHGIQQEANDAAQRMQQRSCFAQLIGDMVMENQIQLICEEWDHDAGETIAHNIAQSHRIGWFNINTTREDLKRMGIHLYYTKLPCPPERKAEWHAKREQFMLRKIEESRTGATELLILCGFDHVGPLSNLLLDGLTDVKTIDYRLAPWYQAGLFVGSHVTRP